MTTKDYVTKICDGDVVQATHNLIEQGDECAAITFQAIMNVVVDRLSEEDREAFDKLCLEELDYLENIEEE